MAFSEDLTIFFDNSNGFSVDFVYTPTVGSPATIKGIFDNANYEAEGGEIKIQGTQPQIVCRSSDVPLPAYGEAVTIGSNSYTIVGIHPDGTGITTLILDAQ